MNAALRRLAVVAALLLASGSAWAGIETRPIHFAKGASSATVEGSLTGDQTVDYTLGAKAGQTMTVRLETSSTGNYFNVLPPGSRDEAVFIGSIDGNEWTGTLEANGDYTIRLYMVRSAARRQEGARYTLTASIAGSPAAQGLGDAPRGDAKVAGTAYHATGTVPCSMGDAPAGSLQCDFGVIRGAPGKAAVHVTPPGGFTRVLTFAGSQVTADGDARASATRSGDAWQIGVNDHEYYVIPDAVINGG